MRKYFPAFVLALVLHLSIIAVFFIKSPQDSETPVIKQKEEPVIIDAMVLDESVVIAKAKELKELEENKEQQQQKQQDDYTKKLAQEELLLKQIKVKRQQAEQEAKKQADQRLKAAQEEQKKLQDIKHKLALEKKKQLEIAKKHEADEKKRLAEEKIAAEEKRKQEVARLEAEKQKKIAAAKKQKAAQEKLRADAAREKEKNRIRAENARIAKKASAQATALIKRKVTQNWNRPGSVTTKLKCKIRIGLIPSGDVMSVVLIESSGNALFDESAERAVRKASPLPVPKDVKVFKNFRSFILEFAPDK